MAMSRTARSAPGSTTIYMERIDDISHSYPFSGGSPYYGYLFYTAEGDTAYCVEPARFNSTTGTVVTGSKTYSGLTQTQQNEIARAIAANPSGHANPYKYMACQAIIWEIAYNQSPRGGSVYNAVIAQNSGKLSSYYEEIRSEMENLGEIPASGPGPQNPTETPWRKTAVNGASTLRTPTAMSPCGRRILRAGRPLTFPFPAIP